MQTAPLAVLAVLALAAPAANAQLAYSDGGISTGVYGCYPKVTNPDDQDAIEYLDDPLKPTHGRSMITGNNLPDCSSLAEVRLWLTDTTAMMICGASHQDLSADDNPEAYATSYFVLEVLEPCRITGTFSGQGQGVSAELNDGANQWFVYDGTTPEETFDFMMQPGLLWIYAQADASFAFDNAFSEVIIRLTATPLTTCVVDLNGDGILDNGDILSFVTLFLAGC